MKKKVSTDGVAFIIALKRKPFDIWIEKWMKCKGVPLFTGQKAEGNEILYFIEHHRIDDRNTRSQDGVSVSQENPCHGDESMKFFCFFILQFFLDLDLELKIPDAMKAADDIRALFGREKSLPVGVKGSGHEQPVRECLLWKNM